MESAVIPKGNDMTETASGSAAQNGKRTRKGLADPSCQHSRRHAPYDEVTWERRDIIMTNWRDGSVNFDSMAWSSRLLVSERRQHCDHQVLPARGRNTAA